MSGTNSGQGSFWTTLPGILTGCGAVITAIAGLIGACVTMSGISNSVVSPTAAMPAATAVSQVGTLNVQYITIDRIQLPQASGISDDAKKGAAALIVAADKAEIQALYYQDDSYLKPYYAGDALRAMQQYVQEVRQSGYKVIDNLDLNKSYYVRMYLNNGVLAIDECEYWKTSYYDPTTGKLVKQTDWKLTPQTISIELMGNQVYITAISFYQNNAFCTR